MLRQRVAIALLSACILCVAAITIFAAPAASTSDDRALAARLDQLREATSRFKDVNVALREGYVRDPMDMCITAVTEGQPPQLGGMGIHYFRPDLLGITGTSPRVGGNGTHTDFSKPAVLVYEPQANGRLELVAVENLVFADAWHAAGNKALPEFEGNQYYKMIDNPATPDVDEAHHFLPHYELHVWLYRDNPNGVFAQFNPNVSCRHHQSKLAGM